MKKSRLLILCGWLVLSGSGGHAQRNYSPHSVLASGNWYKLGVSIPGVYRIDVNLLNNLGVNTSNLASATVRMYGNGGNMLGEANSEYRPDDLREIAIQVVDGGDGVINGTDHILFFAPGPHEWRGDSVNQGFLHRKNIYTDKAYYFLTIGGNGKRVAAAPTLSNPTVTVNHFSERYFHELDSVNFLSSGKEWYGEEMSDLPGRQLSRNFQVSFPGLQNGAELKLRTSCVARSVGTGSRFEIRINGQQAGQIPLNPTGGGPYDIFGHENIATFTAPGAQGTNSINFTFVPGSMNAQGWLNWFELQTRRALSMNTGEQLLFRDWPSVGNSRVEFVVGNAGSTTQVWEVTDPSEPVSMQGNLQNSEYRFVQDAARLREYAAFNASGLLIPTLEGRVQNQDLHGAGPADYLVVTHPTLVNQAQALATNHRQRNSLRVTVVTTEQVFNEFSGGSPDPVAIRDFVKMYWDRFGLTADKPRYLLLFGDASFDYKNRIAGNTNLVPAWQNQISLDPLSTYTSDDFFGFLDDYEDINSGVVSNLLDIGIGRIPAKNAEEAKNFTDKLNAYYSPASFGPWRNNLTFLADDEDGNLHFQDAETISATAAAAGPVFNQQKIYLDAFLQESGPGGGRYPGANTANNNQLFNGTLIWNYNGHGGPGRLAEETILDKETVNNLNNINKLPLFVTATCDFAPFDNPLINSLGENILLRPKTGAIALMTTTRLVFAFSNRVMNNNYTRFALEQGPTGTYRTLGDATREAKNFTYQTLSDIANIRKFTLLGDPAMTLGFPLLRVRPTFVNGIPATTADTLRSTEKITIEGEVTDAAGALLTDFSGYVYPTVYDKPQTVTTLANDPGSQAAPFQVQNSILYRGKASVENGLFRFEFRVPKDINYQFGNGKLSLYAENGNRDGNGHFTHFIIGGTGSANAGDGEGPTIRLYLNDELFANGGLTDQHPVLIVKLADSSGINTAGTGIGHDIVATLDNDNRQYFILNDFYQAELNSHQQGTVRFQLPELEPGPHSLRLKAWDVLNNSNEASLEFTVAKNEELVLSHVLNYPNPFTSKTHFWFEHNKPGQPLQVQIQIMSVTGRIVKSISRQVITEGNRSATIEWDGRDDYGDKLGRGVYLYRLRVTAPDGSSKAVVEKMAIL